MVATATQAALDVYGEDGGDIVFVNVFEGPGENYPVEKVWLYPKECPDKDCMGGRYGNKRSARSTKAGAVAPATPLSSAAMSSSDISDAQRRPEP